MAKKFLLITFLFVSSTLWAQNVTSVGDFNVIDIFGPFDVELIKSDKASVEIDYNRVDKDDVVSEVRHNVLKLRLKNKHYIDEWKSSSYEHRKSDYVRVKIYYVDIDEIEAEAGARVFSRASLKSKNLIIASSMGAEVDLDIVAKNILVKSNMGAITTLSGRAENLEVKASMGCEVKASRLESKLGYVKASMGAVVRVYVTEEIEASAGFGATIDYIGGPTVRHTNTSMGAEINGRYNRH